MADAKSVTDLWPDDAEAARLDIEAMADIDAGNGVPHERVREWLLLRGQGKRIPPPTA